MASSRTPSFYANFFRAVRSCEPTTYRSIRTPPQSRARFRGTTRRAQSTYQNRYGPAATEGLPPPPKPQDPLEPKQADSKAASEKVTQPNEPQESEKENREPEEEKKVEEQPVQKAESTIVPPSAEQDSASIPDLEKEIKEQPQNRELDLVLSVPSPNDVKGQKPRHPHLEPSPYEHHFDTYGLVQDLAKDDNSFSIQQSTTLMKAIRLMLTINLELAKEGLVSKSDIENESYLFRAACSELRTTLQGGRFAENQRQRSNRAHLVHEFDILNQKVSQDILNMKEELKAMFNDRKMGLQEEKRKVDTKISELNYEITVLLNSEAKSEVEGLRWVLTRRAAMAIVVAAFMTLSALQYYSIKSREFAEIEKRKAAAQKAQEEKMKDTEVSRYTTPSRNSGTQTEGILEESLG